MTPAQFHVITSYLFGIEIVLLTISATLVILVALAFSRWR